MDSFPKGLSMVDEHEYIRRVQIRSCMDQVLDWLIGLRPAWKTNVTLTFADARTAPEAAENCFRRWLKKVSPQAWAIVGWELQERGAIHCHAVLDTPIDFLEARRLWANHGFCWFRPVRNDRRQIAYVIKHAIKYGDMEIYGSQAQRQFESKNSSSAISPTQYEMDAIANLSGKREGSPSDRTKK